MSQTTLLPADILIREDTTPSYLQYWLYGLFFLSGFPALIYQIVWQRALFTIYGVNVESVTVVVTAFMLGLGLGSLVGGRISRLRWPLVPVFAVVEFCTSAYGISSLHLFHRAAQATAGASTLFTGLCAFALVVVPTLLMGSTLPILLAYLIKVVPNMGRVTGLLYFANTLGSALACFVAGLFTMRLLGMSGSVRLAASINALVGISALVVWITTRNHLAPAQSSVDDSREVLSPSRVLGFPLGLALAACSGFIALGYEILWYRIFSWASGTNPMTFACLLGAYLAGLAFGALAAQRFCSLDCAPAKLLWFTGAMLVAGNIVAAGLPLMLALLPQNHAQSFAMVWVVFAAALLGTTFPMVSHLTVRPDNSAGEGLSFLYLSNIVGAAAGSFVTGYILTEVLTLPTLTGLLATAGLVLGLIVMRRSNIQNRTNEPILVEPTLSSSAGLAMAAFSGFLSLGYATWWILALSTSGGSNRQNLALLVLCVVGLALGYIVTERRCRSVSSKSDHLWFTGVMLVVGNVTAVLVPSVFSFAQRHHAQLIAMLLLTYAAASLGTTFPMVERVAELPGSIKDHSVKKGRALLSVAFIIGALAGGFVVECILSQRLSLPDIGVLLATVGTLLGLSTMVRSGSSSRPRLFANVLAGASLLAVLLVPPLRTYEILCNPENVCAGAPFSSLVENRHGIIAVGSDNRVVIGGGVYDGRFNLDPLRDDNGITRCYSLFGFLSRPPKHVLMIGLSSGSWAQVVANHPEVESLTIIEINPGYLKLIPGHPEVASLLHNPKVSIVIDDGHRWLLRNPKAKFDLVFMNTTYYWRANSTNLLSREFLELLRGHLEPGGAHFYNTTSSPEAQFTAVSVFHYAVRIFNFIVVSDAPLRFRSDYWRELMKAYRIDGSPVLDLSRHRDQVFEDKVVNEAERASNAPNPTGDQTAYFELEDSLRGRWVGRTVITDDNMAVEWHRNGL